MYSTPTRLDPIWVASLIRCASPPDSVAAARSSVRYPTPTLSRKRSRSTISFMIRAAIWVSELLSSRPSRNEIASRADLRVNWWIPIPPTSTARLSGRSRAPPHSGQGITDMYSSIRSRDHSESVSR